MEPMSNASKRMRFASKAGYSGGIAGMRMDFEVISGARSGVRSLASTRRILTGTLEALGSRSWKASDYMLKLEVWHGSSTWRTKSESCLIRALWSS